MKVVGILGLIFAVVPIEAMQKSVSAPLVVVAQKVENESHLYSCKCFCRMCVKTATQRLQDLIEQVNYISHSQKLRKQSVEVNVPTYEALILLQSMRKDVKTLKGSLKEIKMPKTKRFPSYVTKNPNNILADRKTPPLAQSTNEEEEFATLTNPDQIQLRYFDPFAS